MALTLLERATATAVKLDANMPDWANRVDKNRLDMGHALNCLCGQLFGDFFGELPSYLYPPDHYGTRCYWAFEKGLNGEPGSDLRFEQVRELTKIWRGLVDQRIPA